MIWMELSMDSVTSVGSGWREVKVLTWKWQGGQLTDSSAYVVPGAPSEGQVVAVGLRPPQGRQEISS